MVIIKIIKKRLPELTVLMVDRDDKQLNNNPLFLKYKIPLLVFVVIEL